MREKIEDALSIMIIFTQSNYLNYTEKFRGFETTLYQNINSDENIALLNEGTQPI